MAYLIDFYTQYSTKIINANYSDPVVANTMKNDPNPALFTNGMIVYLNPMLELLTLVFYSDANSFFSLVKTIMYAVTISFIVCFASIYLFIFIRFIKSLNEETKQTHEIVNMIPMFVLKENMKVKEQVWNHRGLY